MAKKKQSQNRTRQNKGYRAGGYAMSGARKDARRLMASQGSAKAKQALQKQYDMSAEQAQNMINKVRNR